MTTLFQDILSTIRNRLSLQEGDLESVAECISSVTHVSVTKAQLQIKKGTLLVSVPPTLKLAILMKQDAVLKHCKDRMIGIYSIR